MTIITHKMIEQVLSHPSFAFAHPWGWNNSKEKDYMRSCIGKSIEDIKPEYGLVLLGLIKEKIEIDKKIVDKWLKQEPWAGYLVHDLLTPVQITWYQKKQMASMIRYVLKRITIKKMIMAIILSGELIFSFLKACHKLHTTK